MRGRCPPSHSQVVARSSLDNHFVHVLLYAISGTPLTDTRMRTGWVDLRLREGKGGCETALQRGLSIYIMGYIPGVYSVFPFSFIIKLPALPVFCNRIW
ncbi:hypothetical protein BDW68DRAFT_81755 [Aspergillus falconensis]